jgi:hypothetical protein
MLISLVLVYLGNEMRRRNRKKNTTRSELDDDEEEEWNDYGNDEGR